MILGAWRLAVWPAPTSVVPQRRQCVLRRPALTTLSFFLSTWASTWALLQMMHAYHEYNEHARASGKTRGHFVVDLSRPGHLTGCLRQFQKSIGATDDNWDATFSEEGWGRVGCAPGLVSTLLGAAGLLCPRCGAGRQLRPYLASRVEGGPGCRGGLAWLPSHLRAAMLWVHPCLSSLHLAAPAVTPAAPPSPWPPLPHSGRPPPTGDNWQSSDMVDCILSYAVTHLVDEMTDMQRWVEAVAQPGVLPCAQPGCLPCFCSRLLPPLWLTRATGIGGATGCSPPLLGAGNNPLAFVPLPAAAWASG